MREEQNFSQKTYYVDDSHYTPLNSTMNLNDIYYYPYVRDAIGSLTSRWDQLYYNSSTRTVRSIEMKLNHSLSFSFSCPMLLSPLPFSSHKSCHLGCASWEHNSRDFIDGIMELTEVRNWVRVTSI